MQAVHLQPVRRAYGVVRVSRAGKRKLKGDRFVSPADQERRIQEWCERERLALLGVYQELDVSGGRPLERRPGLLPAVERIEQGDADVLVVAYFDRLVRSLATQTELLDRVEAAGGSVVALDVGEVSTATSAQWLNASLHGLMSEYYRRQIGEKTAAAKADAVARGVPTFPTIPPGYRRGADGRLVVEPAEAEAVRQAFEMRADGKSVFEIRDFLKTHGIPRTYRSVQTLLASRIVLGEIHSGKLVNLTAHPPIVERALWQQVQSTRAPRGPRLPSERLLVRLGILRCATCGAAMGATWSFKQRGGKRYWKYFCGNKECAARAMISATVIENAVVDEVKRLYANESESASIETGIAAAEVELAERQNALEQAVVAFAGIDAASVNRQLRALQDDVQAATERLRRLRAAVAPSESASVGDWDRLSVMGKRALIRATIERVEVSPGRAGGERITIQSFGQ